MTNRPVYTFEVVYRVGNDLATEAVEGHYLGMDANTVSIHYLARPIFIVGTSSIVSVRIIAETQDPESELAE